MLRPRRGRGVALLFAQTTHARTATNGLAVVITGYRVWLEPTGTKAHVAYQESNCEEPPVQNDAVRAKSRSVVAVSAVNQSIKSAASFRARSRS